MNIKENVKNILKFKEAVRIDLSLRLMSSLVRFKAMKQFNQLICPVSSERVDENRVRMTAFGMILLMGVYFVTGNPLFSALAGLDFFVRAFTKLPYSPISWLAYQIVKRMGTQPVWIDKAPKMFAARIGLLLTLITTAAAMMGWSLTAYIAGSTLVLFAFLECGLNFCAGCWVYTYVVFPLVRRGE